MDSQYSLLQEQLYVCVRERTLADALSAAEENAVPKEKNKKILYV